MKKESESEGDPIRLLSIEFIGGPYDGHTESYYTCLKLLPKQVLRLVCADAFRLLSGDGLQIDADPRRSITSVALYSREEAGRTFRYRFINVISIKQLTDSIRSNKDSFDDSPDYP